MKQPDFSRLQNDRLLKYPNRSATLIRENSQPFSKNNSDYRHWNTDGQKNWKAYKIKPGLLAGKIPASSMPKIRYKLIPKNHFLRRRFQHIHQPYPTNGVMGFQRLGESRRLHHVGQHGVHTFLHCPVNLQEIWVQLSFKNRLL